MRAPLLTLLARNAALLYLSFLLSGLITVGSQSFFARAAPESKQSYLAATLLLGTVGAIVGVGLARRIGFPGRPAWTGALLLSSIGALLWLGLSVDGIAAYVALHLAVRTAGNFAIQEIDRRSVAVAVEPDRMRNDQVSTGMRFMGMLLGPLWFGLFPGAGLPTALVLLLLTAAAVRSAASVVSAPPLPRSEPSSAAGRLRGVERALLAAGLAIYASYYLLASNLVYVLSDLHGRKDAASLGGRLITVVYGAAIVGTLGVARLARGGLGLGWILVAPVMMIFAGLFLGSSLATLAPVSYGVAILLGVGFSLFLLALRNHVTREARRGRSEWLVLYNNLANTSALLSFGAMLALTAFGRLGGLSYGLLISIGLAGLGVAGLVAGGWGSRAVETARD